MDSLKKKNPSQPVTDFSYLFSANILSKSFSLIVIAILTRILTKQEISIIPVFGSVGSLGSVSFGLGILPLCIKLIPSITLSEPKRSLQIAKTAIVVNFLSAIVFSILCFLLSSQISNIFFDTPDKAFIIKYLSIGFGFMTLSECNNYLLKCFSRFKEQAKYLFVSNILYNLMIVSFSYFYGFEGLIFSCVVSSVFNFSISAFYLRDLYFNKEPLFSLKSLLSESWSFYLEGFLNTLKREGDTIIVGTLLGVEELAIYFIAKKILVALTTFYQSVNSIIIIRLSKLKDNIITFKSEISRIYIYQVFILLPIMAIYISFVPLLIRLLGGDNYIDAQLPGSILASIPFIQYLFTFSYWAYIFILLSSFSRFKVSLIHAVLLIPMLFFLGKEFGLIGIVLARLLVIILSGIFMIYYVEKNDHLSGFPTKDFIKMSFILIISFLPFILTQYLQTLGLVSNILVLLAGCIIFILGVHFFYGDRYYVAINKLSPVKITDPIKMISLYTR